MGDKIAGFPEPRSSEEQESGSLALKNQLLMEGIQSRLGETLDEFESTGFFEKRPLVLEERSFSDEERAVYKKFVEEKDGKALEEALAYYVYEKFKDDLPGLAPNIEDPYYYSRNLPELLEGLDDGKKAEIEAFRKEVENDILDDSLKSQLYRQSLQMLQMSLAQTIPQLEGYKQQKKIGPLETEMLEGMLGALLELNKALEKKATRAEIERLQREVAGDVDGLKQAMHRHKMEGIMGDVWMGDANAEGDAKKYQESLQELFQEELLSDAPYRKAAAERLDPAIKTFEDLTSGEFFNQVDRTVESTIESARDTRESMLSLRDKLNDIILDKVKENVPTSFAQGLVVRALALQDFEQDAERIQERMREYFGKIQEVVQKPEFQKVTSRMDALKTILSTLEQAHVEGMTLNEAREKLGSSLPEKAQKVLEENFTEQERNRAFEELVPQVFDEYQGMYEAFTKSTIEIQKPLLLEAWLDVHDELSMFPADTNLAKTFAFNGQHLGRLTQYYMPDIIRQGFARFGLADPQIRAELKETDGRMEEWFKNEEDREKTQDPKPIYRVLRENHGDTKGYSQVALTWSKLTEDEKKELFFRLNAPEGIDEIVFDSPWDEESFPQFLAQVGVTEMGIGAGVGAGYGIYRTLASKGLIRKGAYLVPLTLYHAAKGSTLGVLKTNKLALKASIEGMKWTGKWGGRLAIKILGKRVAKLLAGVTAKAATTAAVASTGVGTALSVGLAALTAYEGYKVYKDIKRINAAKGALEDIFGDDIGAGDVVEHNQETIDAIASDMKGKIGLDYPDAKWSRLIKKFMEQKVMPQALLEWVGSKGGDGEALRGLLQDENYIPELLNAQPRRTERRKMADGREARFTWNGEELTSAYVRDREGKEHTLTGDEVNADMDFEPPEFDKKNINLKTMEGAMTLEGIDKKGFSDEEITAQARMLFLNMELKTLADKCKFSSMRLDIPEKEGGRELHLTRFDLPVDEMEGVGVKMPLVVRANADYTSWSVEGLDQTYTDFYQAALAANMMLKQVTIMYDHNVKGDGKDPFERGGKGIDYDKAWKFWDLRVLSGSKEALPWYRDVIGIDRDKFIEIFNEYYEENLHGNSKFWAKPDK